MSDKSELEMSSVEAQLCVLYAEKQRLEEELGSSQADDILALIDDLNARIADLEVVADRVSDLDEIDTLRVQVAELVAEREAFLLSVDADSLDAVQGTIQTLRTQRTSAPSPMSNTNYDVENAIENAIDMASDMNNNFSSDSSNAVQDAMTIAKDLRTMAEQLSGVFSNSKVTFTGRLHGGQWKLECNNG